ncbi:Uncharacterised protein [Vibrio cholerae]|nr:Uncharacterised protein [Vibrio cholerae]
MPSFTPCCSLRSKPLTLYMAKNAFSIKPTLSSSPLPM